MSSSGIDDQNLRDWRREQEALHQAAQLPGNTVNTVPLPPTPSVFASNQEALGSLLERLAPASPINDDERGGCVWCGGTPAGEPYGYATADPLDHETECAWLEARRFLETIRE